MELQEFIEKVERERPATITGGELARVKPHPWVNRAGSGKDARMRMFPGGVRYERQQGEADWHRVDGASERSDLDVLD